MDGERKTLNTKSAADRIYDEWIDILDTMASGTKSIYIHEFNRFCKRFDTTAPQLYEMRKADQISPEPLERKRIEKKIQVLMAEMEKKGYSASTCKQVRKAMSSFFEVAGMEIHLKRRHQPQGESKGTLVVTKKQILQIIELMIRSGYRVRNVAIILALKDCGLRIGDLRMLNYGDWLNAETVFNERGEPFKRLDPEKTTKMKVYAYIHFGPESVNAVEAYLKPIREKRRGRGETIPEDWPLFESISGWERITEGSLKKMIPATAKKLGLNGIANHSFRKFHRTQLEDAGMPDGWIKKLNGKKASVYSQPELTGKLTVKYLECYDALRVLDKPDKTEIPEIANIAMSMDDIQNFIKDQVAQAFSGLSGG